MKNLFVAAAFLLAAPVFAQDEEAKKAAETQVWFSLDDGDHWHSLRANMPAISIRDLIVKDDDIAVGTHGRGFWILDGVSALRQWTSTTSSPMTSSTWCTDRSSPRWRGAASRSPVSSTPG